MCQQCGKLEIDRDQVFGQWTFGVAEGTIYSRALASVPLTVGVFVNSNTPALLVGIRDGTLGP
jgi:hypothetical protein